MGPRLTGRWAGALSRAAAAARTSQTFAEIFSLAAASSMRAFSCSDRRTLIRAIALSSRSGTAGRSGPREGCVGGRRGDDEAGFTAAQAQFHRARREVHGDLAGRGGQGL